MKKIFCISSHGGHLHELRQAVAGVEGEFCWCTHKTKATQEILRGESHHFIIDPCTSKLMFLVNAVQALWYLILERPDVVISTGAGIAIPSMLIAKMLFGAKLIYVESAASVIDPTKTGKFMYKYCDLFLVQWEEMLKYYPNAKYVGIL